MSRAKAFGSTHRRAEILGANAPVHTRNVVGRGQIIAERIGNRAFQPGRQFRRLPYRVNFARSARTVTLVPQYARDRESTKRTGRLLANEAAHGRSVAPLLPQPCLRAPTQQRFARPLGTGLDKQIVAVEPRGAVGIAQKCPLDESLRYRVVD